MSEEPKSNWKQKLRHELIEYWMTVLYLAIYFGAFNTYRRLILAHYRIDYLNYGVGIIQALILAKVIYLGDFLRMGRQMGQVALIVPTLVRSVMFTAWVVLFTFADHTVRGLLRGEGWGGGVETFVQKGKYELMASCLVVFFTFIPFFALRELNRALGRGRIWRLFFHRTTKSENSKDGISHQGR